MRFRRAGAKGSETKGERYGGDALLPAAKGVLAPKGRAKFET